MKEDQAPQLSHEQEDQATTASPPPGKQPWQEPKLVFIEPKLTKHGTLTEVTGAFFGGFSQ